MPRCVGILGLRSPVLPGNTFTSLCFLPVPACTRPPASRYFLACLIPLISCGLLTSATATTPPCGYVMLSAVLRPPPGLLNSHLDTTDF